MDSLVHKNGKADEASPLLSKATSTESLSPLRPKTFDEALEFAGVGFFHCLLVLVAGWALASDSVEVQCISFVTPQLDNPDANPDTKLAPSKVEEGALDAIIFLGMMFGGYFWGSWSDVVGRRSCLITSLTVNGLFGFASSLAPTYAWFLFFRFGSGVGVGGSLPIAFSYFCEFFSKKNRGPFVIILAGFWTLGSVFAAVTALAIIEHVNINRQLGAIHFTAWRLYVMVCTFPCLSAAGLMVCMPESPSFLFAKGKVTKAIKVLKRIQKINRFCSYRKIPAVIDYTDLIAIAEKESKQDLPMTPKSQLSKIVDKACVVFQATKELFTPAYLRASVVLLVIWFTFSFGYYGLLLWFPEYFKCVHEKELNCTFNLEHPDSCSPPIAVNAGIVCNETGSIYVDSLYTSLATIPGTILGIITVNILGGKIMLALSVFVCGISAFLIRIVPAREGVIVILSCVFNGVAVFGWNALDVISTSGIFPVHLRSTAFGIQAVLGRLGSILGNLSFGRLITVDPFIPILLVAALLLFGGLVGFLLPNPRGESTRKNFAKCARLHCCKHCVSPCYSCCHGTRLPGSIQNVDD